MKKLFLLLAALSLLSVPLWPQTLTAPVFTLTGPSSVTAGQAITMTLNCTGCASSNLQAIQADVSVNGLTGMMCSAGAQLSAASKTTTCAIVGPGYRLIAAGINNNVISDGAEAIFTGTVPSSAAGTKLSFTLTNQLGASSSGTAPNLTATAVTVTVGSPLAVIIPSPCDLNMDGVINATDLGITIEQALGLPTTGDSSADLDGNGVVNVRDIVRIIIAINGGACITGP